MSFDPYAPYGPVVSSTVRVVTWNVWGRYGADTEARQAALEETLAQTAPDLVCLVEAWRQDDRTQPARVAARLNRNPLAAVGLYPDRRFDYILSAWPRRGGTGHPVRCSLLGVREPGELQVSDHYGLAADLRY